MPVIDVVSDSNVVLKWFHGEGEEEVAEARALLEAHRQRAVSMRILDLTPYEVGNALLRGHASASADQVAAVLEALTVICPCIAPTPEDFAVAAALASEHDLTMYDATYGAVAKQTSAELATLDEELLRAGLGRRPSEIVRGLR